MTEPGERLLLQGTVLAKRITGIPTRYVEGQVGCDPTLKMR
jgi:hypothetical protein